MAIRSTCLAALLLTFVSGCSAAGMIARISANIALPQEAEFDDTPIGILYTRTIQPHSLDFNKTRVGSKKCVIDEYKIKEPMTGYGMSVQWSAARIKAEARKAGITKIAYTDIQTESFLLGVYERRKLIVYGD